MAAQFGSVLFMDCTYKTNRFGMPLPGIVGAANTNQTFIVAAGLIRPTTC